MKPTVGSRVCALSVSSGMFIACRVVAGAAVAVIVTLSTDIMVRIVPRHIRPLFLGASFAFAGISSALGPIVGGLLARPGQWPWMFYLNLPIGAVTALVTLVLLPACPA
jgi:MFS family permease